MTHSSENVSRAKGKKGWLLGGALILLTGLGFALLQRNTMVEGSISNLPVFEVREGPLRIVVSETGIISPKDQIVISCEVEGQTQILWLTPEGEDVQEGDMLFRLDSSALEDQLVDRQIQVQNSEAAFINARENLEVVRSEGQSEINRAELDLQFATEDLKKYVEGDFPNLLKESLVSVTLAEANLASADELLKGDERLFERKFISATELDATRRRHQKTTIDLELSVANMALLEGYTFNRRMTELESDKIEGGKALERTRLKVSSDLAQAEARLKAQRSRFEQQQGKLDKTKAQLEKTVAYAPVAGAIIYASRSSGGGHGPPRLEPLEEGQVVRERQEIIHIRTDNAAMAEIGIHESDLVKVRPGIAVRIVVDALPGREFTGHVERVAMFPDAQNSWMSPGLKVYPTEISIDGDGSALRTGMSCLAELSIERHEKTVFVPAKCVMVVKGLPTVFVVNGREIEERAVEVGLANEKFIRIVSNLKPGERVLLAPPLDKGNVSAPEMVAYVPPRSALPKESDPQRRDPQARLDKSDEMQLEVQRRGPGNGEGRERRWTGRAMTAEQRQEMRRRVENMSQEERDALLQRGSAGGRAQSRETTPN